MNWRCKALLQQAFSYLRAGEAMNFFFQRYVTKTYPRPEADFASVLSIASAHLEAVRRHWGRPLEEATFYEFGAGWDLLGPLLFYSAGVERQIVIDLRRHLRLNLVNHTVERLRRAADRLGLRRAPTRPINPFGGSPADRLQECYGITYRAPCDAHCTGLDARSVDCITSTNTLEHIPSATTVAILSECRRLLRDDGLVTFRIDYQDHFSYFDPNISAYNFLRYSERRWAMYNPPIMYQNRLRHRDYLAIAAAAGFEVVEEQRTEGSREDLELLRLLPLSHRFRSTPLPDLAVRSALLVLRKCPSRSLKNSTTTPLV